MFFISFVMYFFSLNFLRDILTSGKYLFSSLFRLCVNSARIIFGSLLLGWGISGGSFGIFLLNFFIFFSLYSLIRGLSLVEVCSRSIIKKFGRWSLISLMRFPAEILLCMWFIGILTFM